MSETRYLDGRLAVVTGAAHGIGEAIARELAARGAALILCDIQADAVERVAADLRAAGADVSARRHDVGEPESWRELEEAIASTGSGLHVMVNNAGIYGGGLLEELTVEAWRRVQRVNVEGVLLGIQAAIRLMKATPAEPGHLHAIVNMSSAAGAGPFSASYRTSKEAVRMLSTCAALECAALGYPIRVNSVHPGLTDTEMRDQSLSNQSSASGVDQEATRQGVLKAHPLGRFALPTDIARAVAFLAGPDADFITGTGLYVDGGLTAR